MDPSSSDKLPLQGEPSFGNFKLVNGSGRWKRDKGTGSAITTSSNEALSITTLICCFSIICINPRNNTCFHCWHGMHGDPLPNLFPPSFLQYLQFIITCIPSVMHSLTLVLMLFKDSDLSFLAIPKVPGQDTPSRWLTFGGTPTNGTNTPGTAFGSPFWASLSQSKYSPKSYSPSKELNPFELSFFPKSVTLAGGQRSNTSDDEGNSSNESLGIIKQEDLEENLAINNSLKRPFEEAIIANTPTESPLHNNHNNNKNKNDKLHLIPTWKRPKFANSQHPSPSGTSSSENATTFSSSPAMVSRPSPDSGSPASTVIPTPIIQNAVLPSALSHFRKTSPSPSSEQIVRLEPPLNQVNNAAIFLRDHNHLEVTQSDLQGPSLSAYPPPSGSSLPSEQQPFPIVQRIPAPLPPIYSTHNLSPQSVKTFLQYPSYGQTHSTYHHQPLYPSGNKETPIIQLSANPTLPSSTQHDFLTKSPSSTFQEDHPVPPSQQENLKAIPYANGRAPSAQPANTVRSKKKQPNLKNVADRQVDAGDSQKLDIDAEKNGSSVLRGEEKTGKRNDESDDVLSKKTITTMNNSNSNSNVNKTDEDKSMLPIEPGMKPIGDEEDEEDKRKAFLERNRQGRNSHTFVFKVLPDNSNSAACRSRQKKKEWIGNLENHAASLQARNSAVRENIFRLLMSLYRIFPIDVEFFFASACLVALE